MMSSPKKIILTVTTDLNYDQRMIRICTSLHSAGYDVEIVGMAFEHSHELTPRPYKQTRIPSSLSQGKMMYIKYWWNLFQYLRKASCDAICAIDLDTILPVLWASQLKKVKRVYDAHEIFTEMQEVNLRPNIKRLWEWIGSYAIPKFKDGYTIGNAYAGFFKKKYNVQYEVVRNATVYNSFTIPIKNNKYILYQGAVNQGRAFEYLIPAMKEVSLPLIIVGKGNFSNECLALIKEHGLEQKVIMEGYKKPSELKKYTEQAYIGITLFDDKQQGLSNNLSMANRFFDYMHHGVPQLCCNFPEYANVNKTYQISHLINDLNPRTIATALNTMINDTEYYNQLSTNALEASRQYCWQNEEKTLVSFYNRLFDK